MTMFVSKHFLRRKHSDWLPSRDLPAAVLHQAALHSNAPAESYAAISRLIDHKVGGSFNHKTHSSVVDHVRQTINTDASLEPTLKKAALLALDKKIAERVLDFPRLAAAAMRFAWHNIDAKNSSNSHIVFSIIELAAKHGLQEAAVLDLLVAAIEYGYPEQLARERVLGVLQQRKNGIDVDLSASGPRTYLNIFAEPDNSSKSQDRLVLKHPAQSNLEEDVRSLSTLNVSDWWRHSRSKIAPEHQWRMYIDGRDWHQGRDAYEKNEPGYIDGCTAADAFIETHLLNRRLVPRDLELLHYHLVQKVRASAECTEDELVSSAARLDISLLNDCCGYNTLPLLFKLIDEFFLTPLHWEATSLTEIGKDFLIKDHAARNSPYLQSQIEAGAFTLKALSIEALSPQLLKLLSTCELPGEKHQVEQTRTALLTFLRHQFRSGLRADGHHVTFGLQPNETYSRSGQSQLQLLVMRMSFEATTLENLSHENDGPLLFCRARESGKQLQARVKSILDAYYEDLSRATDRHSRMTAIVKCCQKLVVVHPFPDGNSRTTYALLRLFLAQIGEAPTYLENPGCIAGFSTDEVIAKINAGQIKMRQFYQDASSLGDTVPEECRIALNQLAAWREIGSWENAQAWCARGGVAEHLAHLLKEFCEYPDVVSAILKVIRESPLLHLETVPKDADFAGVKFLATVLDEGNFAQACAHECDQLLVQLLLHFGASGHAAAAAPRFDSFRVPGTSVFNRLDRDMRRYQKDPIAHAYASAAEETLKRFLELPEYDFETRTATGMP